MHRPPQEIASRLAGLLAFMLAGCLNPVTTAYLLTADKRLDAPALFYSTWILTILLALLSGQTLFRGRRLPLALSRGLLLLFSAGLTFYLTVFLDRLAGRLLLPPRQHLVFPANTAVRYQTAEFDVTAHINHLGFRDREFPVAKKDRFRILVLGDSFTFGWGVALADTWVKQLERRLQAQDPAIEILNLGRSGGSPETYADIAARALPVLQPDLVLVAVLQGNDLQQSIAGEAPPSLPAPGPSAGRLVQIALANAYPHFLRLRQATLAAAVKPVWQQQAAAIEQSLAGDEKARLRQLDGRVLAWFRAGSLNPDLVLDHIRDPDQFIKLEAVHRPDIKKGIRRMSFYLQQISDLARRQGAATWLVAVPHKYYLCARTMREHQSLGLHLDTTLIPGNTPDSILAAEAAKLQLPLLRTDRLRQHCQTSKLYYTYDGHFTPAGNLLFAQGLFTEIQAPLRQLRRRKK